MPQEPSPRLGRMGSRPQASEVPYQEFRCAVCPRTMPPVGRVPPGSGGSQGSSRCQPAGRCGPSHSCRVALGKRGCCPWVRGGWPGSQEKPQVNPTCLCKAPCLRSLARSGQSLARSGQSPGWVSKHSPRLPPAVDHNLALWPRKTISSAWNTLPLLACSCSPSPV